MTDTDSQDAETPVPADPPAPPERPKMSDEPGYGQRRYEPAQLTADDPQSKAAWILVFVGLLAAAAIFGGPWLALTIVAIFVMITIHELGHYLTAKWAGMKVTEFFLGFGPRLWSFRRGETDYGVKPIMAGAYVRIIGMNNLDEVPPEDESRSYRQQSFPKRLIVVLAGPATHFIQVAVLLFVLIGFVGVPGGELGTKESPQDWTVQGVTEDSAAEAAGLKSDDKVIAFDGHEVATFDELTKFIRSSEVGQEVTLTVQRDGKVFDATTTIRPRPEDISGGNQPAEGTPFLGVGEGRSNQTVGLLDALVEAPQQTLSLTGQALSALGHNLSPSGMSRFGEQVRDGADDKEESTSTSSGSEPSPDNERFVSIIGAVRLGTSFGEAGLGHWIFFLVMINIFIGLLNLVPLLPFDGGHAAVAVYERIRSRNGKRYHADVAKLLPVAYAVVMGLIVLGVTTMYLDIVDPIN
jgi:membrane-associated protease RseP (regulator of RpoE activity)